MTAQQVLILTAQLFSLVRAVAAVVLCVAHRCTRDALVIGAAKHRRRTRDVDRAGALVATVAAVVVAVTVPPGGNALAGGAAELIRRAGGDCQQPTIFNYFPEKKVWM